MVKHCGNKIILHFFYCSHFWFKARFKSINCG